MKELTLWDIVKRYYKETYNIPPEYIEFIACYPVLLDCVTGYSVNSISRRTKFDKAYIEEILFQFFKFYGWDVDLEISPIAIFRKTAGNFLLYEQEVISFSHLRKEEILQSFRICKIFEKLYNWSKEIEKEIK